MISSIKELDIYIDTMYEYKMIIYQHDPMTLEIQQIFNLWQEGNHYENQGAFDVAIEKFEQAIKLNHAFANARLALARCFFESGRYNDAIIQYKITTHYAPFDYNIYLQMGMVYSALGRKQPELNSYKAALEINPDCFDARKNIGITYREVGDWDAALKTHLNTLSFLKSKVEVDSPVSWDYEFIQIYYELGSIYFRNENFEQAQYTYKQVLEIYNPDMILNRHVTMLVFCSRIMLGRTYLRSMRWDEALAAFNKTSRLLASRYYDVNQLDKLIKCAENKEGDPLPLSDAFW